MNADEQIDSTITSLKIIAMVQKNGRLCIRKGQLAIESDDRFQAFRRWFNRDSRDQLILHLRNCINNAVKLSRALLANQLETDLRPWVINRLITEMTNSQAGLINLKTTYSEDPAMVAAIDVLIERLIAHCAELSTSDCVGTFSKKVSPENPSTQHQPNNNNINNKTHTTVQSEPSKKKNDSGNS